LAFSGDVLVPVGVFQVREFPNVVIKPFWFGWALTRSYLDFRREPVYCSVVDLDESIINLRGVQVEEFFFPICVGEEDVHRVEVAFSNVEFRPRHVTELLFIVDQILPGERDMEVIFGTRIATTSLTRSPILKEFCRKM